MNKWMTFGITVCFYFLFISGSLAGDEPFFASACTGNEMKFMFFKQSTVIFKASNKTILIDPAANIDKAILEKLKKSGLDLLIFTHAHYDHYDYAAALEIFAATGAHIVAAPEVAKELRQEVPKEKISVSSHQEKTSLNDIDVTAIMGKHIGPIYLYHIAVGNVRTFHGGDSAYIPLSDYPSDVAFVPTGDPSPTCSPKDAFKMVADLKPQVAVAIHGSPHQNEQFKTMMQDGLPDIALILPSRGEPLSLTLKE